MRVATSILLVLVASPAIADDAVQATKLFDEAKALRDGGKLDEACTRFEQSLKLDAQLGTMLNLADCRESQGRRAEAHKLFLEGAALAAKNGSKVRETYARGKADALIAKYARVTVRVADGVASIKLNGRELAKVEWGTQLFVDPGKLVVSATAPDRAPREITNDVTGGAEVAIDVPALEPAPVKPPPPKRDDAPKPSGATSMTPLFVGGGGLVLLGTSIALGLSAKSAYDKAVDEGGPGVDAAIDRAQRRADIATVITAAGAIAVGVGVVLYVRDRKHRVVVAPTGRSDGAGVQLSGSF